MPQCGPYISFNSILTTPFTPVEVLVQYALGGLASVTDDIPLQCQTSLTEVICQSVFQECVNFDNISVSRTPCRSVCTRATKHCAQLFSFANQLPPDCDALQPGSCNPMWADGPTTFPLPTGNVSLDCQHPVGPSYTEGPFYCERFRGKPEVCRKYVDGDIQASFAFTQSDQVRTAEAALTQFAALPDSCRFAAEEYLCKNVFRKCAEFKPTLSGLPTTFYWGRPLCKDGCEKFNVQCGELFGLSGVNLTDCDARNLALENNLDTPPEAQVFYYNNFQVEMTVPCRHVSDQKLPKTFRCEKWNGLPKQCKPYLTKDNGDRKDIFILDAFSMEARSNLTTSFVAILSELPKDCREYATEMICTTLFQECKTFDDEDLPTKYYVGRPPCKSICKNVKNCEKALRRIGIPAPDCGEMDALTGGQVYPQRRTSFKIPNHSYTASCIESIHNPGAKRRFARDLEGDVITETEVVEEDETSTEEEETEVELDEDIPNTFNIASSIAETLSTIYGPEHQAAVLAGLQSNGAFENLARSISEQIARRVRL